MPVIPGIMIGSFGRVFVSVQVSVKIPGLRPPDGNPAVLTGATAGPLVGLPVGVAVDPDDDPDDDPVSDDARLTATTEETVAAEAAARTTAADAAAITNERWMNIAPVNVRKTVSGALFTLSEQSPSTARTLR
jgi:hypothetical protein